MIHELKIKSKYFKAVLDGTKAFEVRYNDRGYAVGDKLILMEIGEDKEYTGNKANVEVTYILTDKDFGALIEGYVVLGIKQIKTISPSQSEIERAIAYFKDHQENFLAAINIDGHVYHKLAIEALEVNLKIKATGYSLEEVISRNIVAWETSKDKSQGLLPEVYITDKILFTSLTGLEAAWKNLNKYIKQ
jgi:ASC-1-like (ASCH) protein